MGAIAIFLREKIKKYLDHPCAQCYENMTFNRQACPHSDDIIKSWLFIEPISPSQP